MVLCEWRHTMGKSWNIRDKEREYVQTSLLHRYLKSLFSLKWRVKRFLRFYWISIQFYRVQQSFDPRYNYFTLFILLGACRYEIIPSFNCKWLANWTSRWIYNHIWLTKSYTGLLWDFERVSQTLFVTRNAAFKTVWLAHSWWNYDMC